jgi:hypothetical protein
VNTRQIVLTLCAVLLPAGARAQQETRNPHGKLKEECAACHGPQSWVPARVSTFDHAKQGFPLLGAHASAGCRSCHVSLNFVGARTECTSCHQDTHRGELGVDCTRCHTPRSFHDQTVMARAHQTTRFPLSGAHAAVACTSCHKPAPAGQLAFASTSVQCVDCHRTQYVAAKSPDHVAGGFPLGCLQCHTSTTWTSARFNHNASSFPLTGAHRATTCLQCHGDGVYNGKNTACVSCHQSDYGTATPNHVTSGFSTTCQSCHTTTTWTGASFNHDLSSFPLTGAHRTATCQQCHGDGVYNGKNTACVSCHQADYNATTDPIHASAGFPTTCQTCHTTTGWTGAAFNHTWFPQRHGNARQCSDCHTTPTNYSVFTCTSCHTKSRTDSDHRGENGYVYNSQNCYACHPRGSH